MNIFIGPMQMVNNMERRPATEIFSEWAEKGRDEGMESGHAPSVEAMLELALPKVEPDFLAIDVGCGNGWVCRKLKKHNDCKNVVGIDGSDAMISKANSIDSSGDYIHADLPEWKPSRKFDLIHSMEFLYYLTNPLNMLETFHKEWLTDGGILVAGVDYYLENKKSHDWPDALNVHMTQLGIDEWKNGMIEAGFSDVEIHQVGKKEGFIGTLVMIGRR
jgi:trans-aconitate methyltransferase